MQNSDRIRTHLFLVGEDLIPNITPVLDTRFSPEEVYLLFSPSMSKAAERLKGILIRAGIKKVEHWELQDPWDPEHIGGRVKCFVDSPVHDGDIVLNATCGTRPMGLAACNAFHDAQKPVYYVHPETDHVVWLNPRSRASFDLADRIKLPAFLTAHDLHLVSARRDGIPANFRNLTDTLVKDAARFGDQLTVLNYYASLAEEAENLISLPVEMHHLQDKDMQDLLDHFSSNGLLKVDERYRLIFPNEEARFFVNGGWLEEYVFGLLFQLRKDIPTIQDLARNLKFEWDEKQSPVKNEIDVAFLADNRHYIIECKTRKFSTVKRKGNPPQGNGKKLLRADDGEALYRLRTLKDYLGGKGTKSMFISYRTVSNSAKQRAEELGITVCERGGLREDLLRDTLRKLVRKGQ